MKKLKDILKLKDSEIRDDDHLSKPDITQNEFANAVDELSEKHKLEDVEKKKKSKFASATIAALNSLKSVLWLLLVLLKIKN